MARPLFWCYAPARTETVLFMTLSIVLPCFNEEENIAQTTRDVLTGLMQQTNRAG